MEDEKIRIMEYLSLENDVSLEEFCGMFSKAMNLPSFEYDAENESEWAAVQINNIEINISHPYERGKLHEWDNSTPENCNFGITLIISDNSPLTWDLEWSLREFVPQYGQKIANIVGSQVYHHRTWIGPGKNIKRNTIYKPEYIE